MYSVLTLLCMNGELNESHLVIQIVYQRVLYYMLLTVLIIEY